MASITWEAFRVDHIRPFIDDESAGDWTNAELMLFCTWALDDFTQWHPRKRTVTLASGTESFALPDDFYRVDLVEWKRTDYYWKFLEEIDRRPGFEFPSTEVDDDSYPVGYWVEDDTLYLGRTAEVDFTLFYYAYWPTPSGDDDAIIVPRWARQALTFYVAAMALLRKSIGFAKIRQWNTRTDSGKPTDEPLMPEVEFLLGQYKAIINDHTPLEDIMVYYEGRG
jgi:hypothetical protein